MEKEKEILAALPHAPGVYIFKDRRNSVIYVGKAIDLFRRVHQYFSRDDAIGEKTKLLVSQIYSITTIPTANEFDALLLEAKLIHDRQPHFNVIAKDDKSPIYIVLTVEEELPHVLLLRKTSVPGLTKKGPVVFGPFQSTGVAKSLLRTIRQIVPYCTQKQRNGRACFYTHLGLCCPCPSRIVKMPDADRIQFIHIYRRNIFRIKAILTGKERRVRKQMESDMQTLAKQNKFEEANSLKHQIQSLLGLETSRFDPSLYLSKATLVDDTHKEELKALRSVLLPYIPALPLLARIECIDISNTGGKESTGSLVVLTNGIIDSSQYRKFRIKRSDAPNDTAMIGEVISRRIKHKEWPRPDLIVVDGGKGQVHAAAAELLQNNQVIPVVGLAKRFEEIIVPLNDTYKTLVLPLASPAMHILQRIRDEAHRFARSYHLFLRSQKYK